MLDKSGRVLQAGDLVLCLRNKGHLKDLEYAIVVADGKVYNGNGNYTVGDLSYKAALTEKEIKIRDDLIAKLNKKAQLKRAKTENAETVKEVGTVFTYGDNTYIYLGKGTLYDTDDNFEKSGFFYLAYEADSYGKISLQGIQQIQQACTVGTLDMSTLNVKTTNYNSYNHTFSVFNLCYVLRAAYLRGQVVGKIDLVNLQKEYLFNYYTKVVLI